METKGWNWIFRCFFNLDFSLFCSNMMSKKCFCLIFLLKLTVRRWEDDRQVDLSTVFRVTVGHYSSWYRYQEFGNGNQRYYIGQYIYIYKQLSEVKQQRAGIRRCNVESAWSKEEETPGSSVVLCFYTLIFHYRRCAVQVLLVSDKLKNVSYCLNVLKGMLGIKFRCSWWLSYRSDR